jgi:hypothetical protein
MATSLSYIFIFITVSQVEDLPILAVGEMGCDVTNSLDSQK